jgi:hypothetical protein
MNDTRPSRSEVVAALTASRRADSARRRQRVLEALDHAIVRGDRISVSAIAYGARVHRTFIYRHRDLLEQIRAAEAAQDAHLRRMPNVGLWYAGEGLPV